jgi:hypothetical protein
VHVVGWARNMCKCFMNRLVGRSGPSLLGRWSLPVDTLVALWNLIVLQRTRAARIHFIHTYDLHRTVVCGCRLPQSRLCFLLDLQMNLLCMRGSWVNLSLWGISRSYGLDFRCQHVDLPDAYPLSRIFLALFTPSSRLSRALPGSYPAEGILWASCFPLKKSPYEFQRHRLIGALLEILFTTAVNKDFAVRASWAYWM